jgi:hypothetical protein
LGGAAVMAAGAKIKAINNDACFMINPFIWGASAF